MVELGVDLHARTDSRFVDAIYKLLISNFNYTPSLKKNQFLCHGQFMERRMMMIVDCVGLVMQKHNSLVRTAGSVKSRSSNSLVGSITSGQDIHEEPVEYEDENESPTINQMPIFNAPAVKQADPLRMSIDERRKALSDFQRSIQYPLKKTSPEEPDLRASVQLDTGIQTEPMPEQDETDYEFYDESDGVSAAANDDIIEIREFSNEDDEDLFASVDQLARRQAEMTLDELEPENESIDEEPEQEEAATFEVLQQAVEQVKSLTEMMISFMDRLDRIEAQSIPFTKQPDQSSK